MINALQQNPLNILWVWLIIINLTAFIVMGVDKYKAKHKKWRIPEKRLFLIAGIGGSFGGIIGMYVFHHKTLHKKFAFGFPAIFCLQFFIGILIYMNIK